MSRIKAFLLLMFIVFQSSCLMGQSALYLALKEYSRDNIVPVMKERRALLDQVLSAEEVEEINRLRWQFRDIMRTLSEDEVSMVQSEEIILIFGRDQELIEELMSNAWDIAEVHEETIGDLLDAIKDDRKQWRKDWKRIIKQFSDSEDADDVEIDTKFKDIFLPAFFVLWSPSGLLFDFDEKEKPYQIKTRIYPNPIMTEPEITVSIQVEAPGQHEIHLVRRDGQLIQSKTVEYFSIGEVNERLDVSNLLAGTYFVQVRSKYGLSIQPIVKDRSAF